MLLTGNAPLDLTLPDDVHPVTIDEDAPIPTAYLDAEVAILRGQRAAAVSQLAAEAPALRWIQTLAAGPDGVLRAGFGPHVTVTNGRGLHSKTVAEAALAMALAGVLRYPEAFRAQQEHRWAHAEFGAWRTLHPEGQLGSLIDTRVLIWGFGAIGVQTARLFAAMSARVRGVARSAGVREGFPVVTEADLLDELPTTDILVMVLPQEAATRNALSAERLAALPEHAWVINVGRGTTVDQEALNTALRTGKLGGAALDVTYPEPYPADGPLWDAPNTIILPHMAGGVAHGLHALVSENLVRWRAGERLLNVVAGPGTPV
ncbi:MAG: NAD(P)-dependent oxidoreductase [Propioniciclava sp.]